MSIFKKIGAWFAKIFKSVATNADSIAVAITEGVQDALKSGVLTAIADVIEGIFPGVKNIPDDIIKELQDLTPKVLAAELSIQGLPDNPTEEQLLAFEQSVLDAFNVHDQKSKLYTTLSAQIYGILQRFSGQPSKTFADAVKAVEEAYQAYKNDLADQQTAE